MIGKVSNVLPTHTDEAAPDAAFFDEPAGDVLCGVNADGKADALGREDDGRIDPDHLAARVDKRAAGISRVQRGIGLQDIVNEPAGIGAKRAAESAHDPGGDGALKAVWVANGDGDLSYPGVFGFSQAHRA